MQKKHKSNADRQRAYRLRRKGRTRERTRPEEFRRKLLTLVQWFQLSIPPEEVLATILELARAVMMDQYCRRRGESGYGWFWHWLTDQPSPWSETGRGEIAERAAEILEQQKRVDAELSATGNSSPEDNGKAIEALREALGGCEAMTDDDVGDPDAPPGSVSWAKWMCRQMVLRRGDLDADVVGLQVILKELEQHQAWKKLGYPSLEAMCGKELNLDTQEVELILAYSMTTKG
jgi:hypothetical protein